jgi:hypothetical protein
MTAGSGLFANERGINPSKTVAGKGGLPGEVGDLRRDIAKTLGGLAASGIQEFVDPILGAATSLLIATATVAAAVTLLPADLTTATLTNMADNPRQVVFTTAGGTPADAPATATVKGKDPRGLPLTETIALAQTAAAVTTNNFFSEIESISYPAADGTGATVAIGIGAKLGLAYSPKTFTASGQVILAELEDNAPAGVAGTFVSAGATDLPYGSYTPNSALNGALDFVVCYVYDPSV